VLRHRILNNELPAESRLVEANIAAEFGVSRGTIRDAMRSLQAEGLIDIVPRRYSVVTRMSTEDAEDVCFARYVLEDASLLQGDFGSRRKELLKSLRLALEHMSVAARLNDMDALVDSDTQFHEVLIDVSGRRRGIVEAVSDGDLARLRAELRAHYLTGFPSASNPAPGDGHKPGP
jgi:DNA-binding GntR family transcriptional regulator